MTMRNQLIGATLLGAAAVLGSLGTAKADLIITTNGNAGGVPATPETPVNGGPGFPCNGCTTNPVTTFGYTTPASLVAETTGNYLFTFEGAGNASNNNTFTSTATGAGNSGGGTFIANGIGGTGAGSSPEGASFVEHLIAGTPIDISFTLTSSIGSTQSCSISDDAAAVPASGCNYLIALANSPTSPGATGPSQTTAWIGFSDSPPPDQDYQDLVVQVVE